MEVIPAVDVLEGRVVRLLRGDFNRVTVYSRDPVAVARTWGEQGAERLHVVDLEGARSGSPTEGLCEWLAEGGVRFQLGGGIRDVAAAQQAIASGAERVVVGTAAIEDATALSQLLDTVGSAAIVAALDVREGKALGSGWVGSGRGLGEALAEITSCGVRRALVTGISRDGTMEGPDLELIDSVRVAAPDLDMIASGGVGSLDDLAALARRGVEAVIVGRALYEGRFTFEEAQQVARAL